MSVRLKLTLSYAVFLMAAGAMLLTVVWVFLLRGGLEGVLSFHPSDFMRALDPNNFGPRVFGAAAALVMMFLLIFGLVGG
jgi:two-component system sensor histidine kinase VanS